MKRIPCSVAARIFFTLFISVELVACSVVSRTSPEILSEEAEVATGDRPAVSAAAFLQLQLQVTMKQAAPVLRVVAAPATELTNRRVLMPNSLPVRVRLNRSEH